MFTIQSALSNETGDFMSKPLAICHTRDGRAVEIIAVLPPDRAVNGGDTIIGITDSDGHLSDGCGGGRFVRSWGADGRDWPDRDTNLDIIDLPAGLTTKGVQPPCSTSGYAFWKVPPHSLPEASGHGVTVIPGFGPWVLVHPSAAIAGHVAVEDVVAFLDATRVTP